MADKIESADNQLLQDIVTDPDFASRNQIVHDWNLHNFFQLKVLKNAVAHNPMLTQSRINNLKVSENGLTACSCINPSGEVSVVFRGTGSGEWIDNGEGLSGIPETNTYITYGKMGKEIFSMAVHNDYATDQQVEALNWFNKIVAAND